MKKILLRLFLFIIMFFGIVPVTSFGNTNDDVHEVVASAKTRTLYFNLGPWDDDSNAYFEAWTWGGSSSDAWVSITGTRNGTYSAEIPIDRTGMKILRKDKNNHASHQWQSWNEFGNIDIHAAHNTFTATGWNFGYWSWSGGMTYNGTVFFNKPVNSTSNWDKSDSLKYYLIIGNYVDFKSFEMTNVPGTNLYKYNFSSSQSTFCYFSVIANKSWDSSGTFGPSVVEGATAYTEPYFYYQFDYGSHYLLTPSSNSNGATLNTEYKKNSDTMKTVSINITTQVTTNGTSFSNSSSCGTTEINSYYIDSDWNIANATDDTSFNAVVAAWTTFSYTTKPGYTFLGWYNSSGTEVSTANNYKVCLSSSLTLYAKWKANTYNLTFDTNGGQESNTTNSVIYSTNFTFPSNPTHVNSNVSFEGWYNAKTGTKSKVTSTTYSTASNSTLYAIWSGSVTFYADITNIINNFSGDITNPFIHYWSSSGQNANGAFGSLYMTKVSGNVYKYIVSMGPNMDDIAGINFGFYEDGVLKQTDGIIFDKPITVNDSGKNYRILIDETFSWTADWKISNIEVDDVVPVINYYDCNELVRTETIYSYTYKPRLIKKDGMRLTGWYTDAEKTQLFEKNKFGQDSVAEYNVFANYEEAHEYYIYVDTLSKPWDSFSVYMWSNYFQTEEGNTPKNAEFPGQNETNNPNIVSKKKS